MSWDASFTFLIACSASLFSASGALAWGFTMAFLLWFTLQEKGERPTFTVPQLHLAVTSVLSSLHVVHGSLYSPCGVGLSS